VSVVVLSQRLAEYIHDIKYEDLPKDVVEFTKLCILDFFGSAIAGSTKKPIKIMEEMVRELGGEPQATLMIGGRNSITNAALVNGAASHIMELDDIHKTSIIHAGTVIIPAAIAVSEWKKSSGKDLITAIVAGYEVAYRIGEAVTPSHYYYWHNTATCGTFGAAASAGKLLNLNKEELTHALGSAGTQAAGLWEFIEDGAMSKQLHPGKAAMNGVISALLAQKGFTGASEILEGRRGFFEAMSKEYDVKKVTRGLGDQYKITENSFKIHASCRHTHHVMDLMIELHHEDRIALEEIDKIVIHTYQNAIDITDNSQPSTEYAAKFSLQFCTALALLQGNGDFDQFNQKTLWDKKVRQLMARVFVRADPEMTSSYPKKWGAKAEIFLTSGNVITKMTDFPKGDPEKPVTKKELLAKFMKMTSNMPKQLLKNFVDKLMDLENLIEIGPTMSFIEESNFERVRE